MEKNADEDGLGPSELKYRRLFESARDGIIILDADSGRITDINPFLVTLLGYPFDRFIGKEIWEIGLFKDVFANRNNFLELKERKYIRYDNLPLQASDGRRVDVEFISNVYPQGDRSVIQCNIRDITERKKAAALLMAEKERLAVTLRSIGEGVITTGIDGRVEAMNAAAEDICGRKEGEARGEGVGEVLALIDWDSRASVENPALSVLKTGLVEQSDGYSSVSPATGIELRLHCGAAPIKDSAGRTIGAVLVFRDTTDARRMIEVAQRSQKLESLGLLAGGIAHDFNNLMMGIYGYIGMAIEETKDPAAADYLNKALATIDRARGLTQQLLTFAKGGESVRKETPIGALINETIPFSLSGSNVTCSYDIQDGLRNCLVDKNQICQVIDNIVINAKQSMPLGGEIHIAARNVEMEDEAPKQLKKGHYIKITISDRGSGIPKDQLPRIFDPFYSTKANGHGLGLSMCFSIIDQHDGLIEVESRQGEGSAFHIYLPALERSSPAAAEPVPAPGGGGRIIVMDDEDILRETLGNMLVSLGYTVSLARNGPEATEGYFREKGKGVAAMILDLTVPGGRGGLEAIDSIRKDDPGLPVFITSGYVGNDIMRNPLGYGFTASIPKPFTKGQLALVLDRHLRR